MKNNGPVSVEVSTPRATHVSARIAPIAGQDTAPGRPIKVVYDISVLGLHHRSSSIRAGIFRTAERVAQGLARSRECELMFSATFSMRALNECLAYLQTDPDLLEVPVAGPRRGKEVVRALYNGTWAINCRPEVGISAKIVRRALLQAIRVAEAAYQQAVPHGLPLADVFHSPIFALPSIRGHARLPRRFLTVHDLITVRFPQFFDATFVRYMDRVYRSVGPKDWALAVSENTKADFCDYRGINPDRVFVTHWAADQELFYPCSAAERQAQVRRRYGIPQEAPYVLSLNTLEPRKNMDHAIRAFVRLVEQERLPELRFVLVGATGWKYEKIVEALSGAGARREQIILTGYVADEDLAPLYSGALAFVYPSLYEGFGLPPLEAMQCGVPVITSNTSSLPEVVGEAGIMLDPADVDGLCQSLLALYQSAELREQMRAKSLARAQQFSWERCIEQTLAAYRAALAT